jgi:DNA-binding PadR family transcriptional regulator
VSAYVVLYKLQSRGFVSTKQDGNRTVYTITRDGKRLLSEAKKELQGMVRKLL